MILTKIIIKYIFKLVILLLDSESIVLFSDSTIPIDSGIIISFLGSFSSSGLWKFFTSDLVPAKFTKSVIPKSSITPVANQIFAFMSLDDLILIK